MEIYFVRHGQTNWNLEKKVQGKADIELNEEGKIQAEETRNKLKDEKFDIIICSPLKRARETAGIINKDRNLEIIYDERISERDFGEFEGKNTNDFGFEDFWNYSKDLKYEKAENIKTFFERIYNFIEDIKNKYPDKNILLVAHGGVSIPLECYFKGIPQGNVSLLSLSLKNCEIAKYTVEKELSRE